MQLFGKDYTADNFYPDPIPRYVELETLLLFKGSPLTYKAGMYVI